MSEPWGTSTSEYSGIRRNQSLHAMGDLGSCRQDRSPAKCQVHHTVGLFPRHCSNVSPYGEAPVSRIHLLYEYRVQCPNTARKCRPPTRGISITHQLQSHTQRGGVTPQRGTRPPSVATTRAALSCTNGKAPNTLHCCVEPRTDADRPARPPEKT